MQLYIAAWIYVNSYIKINIIDGSPWIEEKVKYVDLVVIS